VIAAGNEKKTNFKATIVYQIKKLKKEEN